MPCSLVGEYQRFTVTHWLHLQDFSTIRWQQRFLSQVVIIYQTIRRSTPTDCNLNTCNHEKVTFCLQILKTSKVSASYTVMFLIKNGLLNCHTLLSAKNLCFSHITVNTSPCSSSVLSCCNRGTLCSGQVGGQDTAGGFVFWSLILHCKQTPIKDIIKWDWKLLWWQLWRLLSSRMWCHVVW